MDLNEWIDDAISDVMALGDLCAFRGLTATEGAFQDLIATLQAERQRRVPAPTRTNVVAFVPRGAQAPMTGTFLPVLGAADGVA
ncbi:hypothetical protein FHG66_03675 [Rubellimicrobium rubrum]|uniref:Uncharacterized protein n=1 Tax=Rubellimicrobium rubrum TaxID=2585369 RepID=A0A5C4N6D5_9RHOB|nr:hypothetical protein [Rubellimicrobium rubrum]TNC51921.1 hypothetical protein FHG66_03675 [Rubellimicrobium rubrum]